MSQRKQDGLRQGIFPIDLKSGKERTDDIQLTSKKPMHFEPQMKVYGTNVNQRSITIMKKRRHPTISIHWFMIQLKIISFFCKKNTFNEGSFHC